MTEEEPGSEIAELDDTIIVGDGRSKNSRRDQDWLFDMRDQGKLKVLEPDGDDETPYGAMVQWDGNPDTEGSPYQIPGPTHGCKGHSYVRDGEGRYILDENNKRLTRPCGKWPIKGGSVCNKHGGGTPAIIAAAKLRLLNAADAITGALVSVALDKNVPHKDRIAAMNSVLDRIGVKSGVDVTVEIKPWQDLLKQLEAEDNS